MTADPYTVLGVARTATQDEIKKAYRRLAKRLHPDLHPGDAAKQAEFQAAAAAYDLLGDDAKRRRYDAGEIDASGQERPERQYYHHYAGQDAGRRYDPAAGAGGWEDYSDLVSDLFGRRPRGDRGHGRVDARGPDLRYHLEVDFLDAARGARRSVTMGDGRGIEIAIPEGLRDGQTLRLRGKGAPGPGQGPAGDALVTVAVRPHPVYRREGDDIEIDLPITVDEAVLGARVDVPTIWGPVAMTIPRGASSGHRLRLKGKGIRAGRAATGDQVVRLRIVLPDRVDSALEEIARTWRARAGFDPRTALRRDT